MTYIAIILLLVLIVVVAILIPQRLDKTGANLKAAVRGLMDDYYSAHTEDDLEKKKLRFHKLTVSADRVLSHILSYYGHNDKSVKQQIVKALKAKTISYDNYQILKKFHHMRNEVVHEGLEVYGTNETFVYGALEIMKGLVH